MGEYFSYLYLKKVTREEVKPNPPGITEKLNVYAPNHKNKSKLAHPDLAIHSDDWNCFEVKAGFYFPNSTAGQILHKYAPKDGETIAVWDETDKTPVKLSGVHLHFPEERIDDRAKETLNGLELLTAATFKKTFGKQLVGHLYASFIRDPLGFVRAPENPELLETLVLETAGTPKTVVEEPQEAPF